MAEREVRVEPERLDYEEELDEEFDEDLEEEDYEDEDYEDRRIYPRRPSVGARPLSLLGASSSRRAAYSTTEHARDIIDGAPKDSKAYGWWRIEKVERQDDDGGAIMNRTVGWVMMLSAGTDPKSYLYNYIRNHTLPKEGPGEYMVRGCDIDRQPLPDSEFFPFSFKGEAGKDGVGSLGLPHSPEDFEMRRIKRRQEELKIKQMDLAIEEDMRRIEEKRKRMAGDGEPGPFYYDWIQYYEDEGEEMPSEIELKKVSGIRPPASGGTKAKLEALQEDMRRKDEERERERLERRIEESNRETREMIKEIQKANQEQMRMLIDQMSNQNNSNPMVEMLMQQNQEAERRREEDKRREEDRRREEKERYERERKEEQERREEEKRRWEEERKEERRRYEEDRRREEERRQAAAERERERQERMDQLRREEIKATQQQMSNQAKADREMAAQNQQMMMNMMQMFKADAGGSTKQVMSLIEKQSDLMTNVASSQLSSAMQNSQAFLEMAGSVRKFIGDKKEEGPSADVISTLINQAGGVLQAYAGAQAKVGALSGIASQLGISEDQLKQVVSSGMIPGLNPAAAQHLQGGGGGMPTPGIPPAGQQPTPANTTPPQGPRPPANPNEPYPTPPPSSAAQQQPQGGGQNMSLILGNFLQHPLGAEVFTLITNCMKADAGETDCVHSVITNADKIPPIVLTFLQYQSHADVSQALGALSQQAPQIVSPEAVQTFSTSSEWWEEFQEQLRESVAYARGEIGDDDEDGDDEDEDPKPKPDPTPESSDETSDDSEEESTEDSEDDEDSDTSEDEEESE